MEPASSDRFADLRGVRWRINLGVLPSSPASSSIDDLRRVTADTRRRYAGLRRRLLVDPHLPNGGDTPPDLVNDNPLSQNPDSTWGRFFRNAELEKMVDQDLSRLYPENGSYFQTPGCQGMLRRILLLWSLRNPEYGYRQGMHELLAPLLYVIHADVQRLSEVRRHYEDHFTDKFDELLLLENDNFNFRVSPVSLQDDFGFREKVRKHISLDDLDPSIQTIVLLSDTYGAEGELGSVLSEKFLEHDAYCMFDALMSGAGGAVAMAEFFSPSPQILSQTGLPPVIEASSALYHLLSIVDSSLYSHLVELGVEPQYFALRWLRVLFGREFLLEDLLIIWDEVFSFDNSRSIKAAEHDPGSSFGALNSPRGAFISAMAVSMLLNMRSSLLATENATSCLQRLLNFHDNVDLEKLLGKAKSLLALALDADISSFSAPVIRACNQNESNSVRCRNLSLDSVSHKTPVTFVPERYWEEKWRVLHKDEEFKKDNSVKPGSSQKKGWTQKIKLRLSRSESDPSPSWRESRGKDHKSSVRRSLLEDLSKQLAAGDDIDKLEHNTSCCQEDLLHAEANIGGQDVHENVADVEKGCSSQNTVSEENSPIFSDPASPVSGSNCLENDSEKSSVASNILHDVNEGEIRNHALSESTVGESPVSTSDPSNSCVHGISACDETSKEASVMGLRDRRPLLGKFQWFWKFGRNASSEGTSDKGQSVVDTKFSDGGGSQGGKLQFSVEEDGNLANVKRDGLDQNLICSLRNIGQSLLHNIQAIESVFQQDRSRAGLLDVSDNVLVEKQGQVIAMAAFKELRKISNLLLEM